MPSKQKLDIVKLFNDRKIILGIMYKANMVKKILKNKSKIFTKKKLALKISEKRFIAN